MAQRTVLCIDPDAGTVAEIRAALQPYGIHLESIRNGDLAIGWAAANRPAMIILSVEPKKVGYAICNKLRRNPVLQNTPVLLISAEETQATFDQHMKLKSRADAYLLKPLRVEDVLAIIDRLVGLGAAPPDDSESGEEIELADDEIAEVSLDDEDALMEAGTDVGFAPEGHGEVPGQGQGQEHGQQEDSSEYQLEIEGEPSGASAGSAAHEAVPSSHVILGADESDSLQRLGEMSRPIALEPDALSPFQEVPVAEPGLPGDIAAYDAGQFERDTQAAFAALEAGTGEGGPPASLPGVTTAAPAQPTPNESVHLQSLFDDEELPEKMPWEYPQPEAMLTPPPLGTGGAAAPQRPSQDPDAADAAMIFGGVAPADEEVHLETDAGPETPLPMRVSASFDGAMSTERTAGGELNVDDGVVESEEIELAEVGDEDGGVPPLPEEVMYDDRAAGERALDEQRLLELAGRVEVLEGERNHAQGRAVELQSRIDSLEAERATLRRELDEQRDRMTHAASQGAFSKERDMLSLREVINKKEKDILDLRDALDAKERQILDHKDKIRENERARRDLEERTLGFEKSLFLANEKAAELIQDRDKSIERERGLKARLDDAHEELRKGQDEIEALRKRITQEVERGRTEVDKTRIELEGKLIEARESHHLELSKATDEWNATQQGQQIAYQAELGRMESAHRVEVEALQRRLADESTAAADRLQAELSKLRRDHEKTITSMKDEQALQLASERQAYEVQTDIKQRAHRDEIMGLRRRHEEELAAAEDRRQRDILEQEQRRVAELEQAENRRRSELQGRDEEHHGRVTEIERRHLIERTESTERYRLEFDQAVGRAVRAEGELIARSQELEQAYRRLAGFEADLDAARMELGDRDLKLTQSRDRIGELEGKLSDYEDQIVRAYQRLRTDEKTGEKIRRALAVALALMDERASGSGQSAGHKSTGSPAEEAEKS